MPLAAGFVGIIPALGLLDETRDGVSPLKLTWVHGVAWSLAVAFFGYVQVVLSFPSNFPSKSVLLAPPIRKQVVREPFAAHIISVHPLLFRLLENN